MSTFRYASGLVSLSHALSLPCGAVLTSSALKFNWEIIPQEVDEVAAAPFHLLDLPSDIFGRFLRYLNPSDITSFCVTSHTSMQIAKDEVTELHVDMPPTSKSFSRLLKTFSNARTLVIDRTGGLSSSALSNLAVLTQLHSLTIGDISALPNPQALFTALFGLRQLTKLDIGFGIPMAFPTSFSNAFQGAQSANSASIAQNHAANVAASDRILGGYSAPIDAPDFDMSPLLNLRNLKHLALRRTPKSWNARQDLVFSFLTKLETLEISYRALPANLAFLSHLSELTKLRLTPAFSNDLETKYALPLMPNLEQLYVPEWSVTSASLKQQPKLRLLHFTPLLWKRSELKSFSEMPRLRHLEMRVHYLPVACILARAFVHIRTLKLNDFDKKLLDRLHKLKNLRVLMLNGFKESKKISQESTPSPIPALIKALPNLMGFSLIGVEHIDLEASHSILQSRLRMLELSGEVSEVETFIKLGTTQYCNNELIEFTAHAGGNLYKWCQGDAEFSVTTASYDEPSARFF